MRLTNHIRLHGHRRQSNLAPLLVDPGQVLVVLVRIDYATGARVEGLLLLLLLLLRVDVCIVLA